jgi:uracil-DNA glycosylase
MIKTTMNRETLLKGTGEWRQVLEPGLDDVITNIMEAVDNDASRLTPPPDRVMAAFRLCKYNNVRVIILGGDPHPDEGQADGLCFSTRAGDIPANLVNIYECLLYCREITSVPSCTDIIGSKTPGSLDNWAKQGVLMLNNALTCELGGASHNTIWANYIKNVLSHAITSNIGVAVFAWGRNASNRLSGLTMGDAVVYRWRDPNPLSNNSAPEPEKFKYFRGFSAVNTAFACKGQDVINWDPRGSNWIFTDGSYKDKRGGWGMYDKCRNIRYFGRLPDPATNNRGEMIAVIASLRHVWELRDRIPYACIVSDSMNTVNTVRDWMWKWYTHDRSLRTKPSGDIENSDLVQVLFQMWVIVRAKVPLDIVHVYAHQKLPDDPFNREIVAGNHVADEIADEGRHLHLSPGEPEVIPGMRVRDASCLAVIAQGKLVV